MASILTEICQVSTLLDTTDKFFSRFLTKASTTKLFSFLIVSFVCFHLPVILVSNFLLLFLFFLLIFSALS